MMGQRDWEFPGGRMARSISDASSDKFDDDLFNAALLFLDQPYGETDSDSHSTPEPPPPHQDEELFWQTMDAEFSSLGSSDRPAKMPRTAACSIVKIEQEASPLQHDAVSSGSLSGISGLWENEPQDFRPAAPRRVNKRKEEIKVLRAQALALEARLKTLHKQPLKNQRDDAMSMDGVFKWREVASQQLEQRKLSESENRRLKELTSEQRRIAKALKRIAARQSNSKTWEPFRTPPAYPPSAFGKALMLDDPNISAILLASLDNMLGQTDSMLTQTTGRVVSSERYGDCYMSVKLQDSRMVPFGVAKTASAVWNYTLLNQTVKPQQWSSATDGSFQSEFIAHVDLGQFRGQAEGKLVVRRVEERGRTVIVRHSLFHCLTAGQSNRFLTVPMRHFLWTVIDRPLRLGVASGRDTISRIRTCAVSMPRLDVGDLQDPTRAAEIDDLKEMCTQIATQQSEQAYDIVDNMLLGITPPKGGKVQACQAAL